MKHDTVRIASELKEYPLGLFGHKLKVLQQIIDLIPEGTRCLAEPFGGTGIVTAAVKRLGIRVITNDVMHFARLRLRVLVKSNAIQPLTRNELDMLWTPNPTAQNHFRKHYGYLLGDDNAAMMDSLAANIPLLGDPTKQDTVVFSAVATVLKLVTHNRQTTSFSPMGILTGNRELSGRDIAAEARRFAAEVLPTLIHDNGKNNEVLAMDGVEFCSKVDADVIYADPPYVCSAGQYEEKVHLYDKLVLMLMGRASEIVTFRNGHPPDLPWHRNWFRQTDAAAAFADLFDKARHVPLMIVSYNNTSGISPEQIERVAVSCGWGVVRHDIKNYPRPSTTAKAKAKGRSTTTEVLLECRPRRLAVRAAEHDMCHAA